MERIKSAGYLVKLIFFIADKNRWWAGLEGSDIWKISPDHSGELQTRYNG